MMKTAGISHRSLESLHSIRVTDTSSFRGNLVRASSTNGKLGSLVFTRGSAENSCTGSLMSIYDDRSEGSLDTLSDSGVGSTDSTRSFDEDYLTCYQWYVGKLSRLEAEQCLEDLRNGTYLVRRTVGKTPEYTHAIAVRWENQPFHIRLYSKDRMFSVANFHCMKFSTIEELIGHFQQHSLASNFPAIATKLLYPYHEEIGHLNDMGTFHEAMQSRLPVSGYTVDTSVSLIEQEWYHGRLSRDTAENILSSQPDCSFLLRDSESVPGGYSLSIRDGSCGGYIHLRISYQRGQYIIGQYSKPFNTLPDMIAYYCEHCLNIKGIPNISLKYPVLR